MQSNRWAASPLRLASRWGERPEGDATSVRVVIARPVLVTPSGALQKNERCGPPDPKASTVSAPTCPSRKGSNMNFLPEQKQIQILRCLTEGMAIRATARVVGTSKGARCCASSSVWPCVRTLPPSLRAGRAVQAAGA